MCLSSKQSSIFSFYALPSSGKSKAAVVHLVNAEIVTSSYVRCLMVE